MIFYFDGSGNAIKGVSEKVYQGSNRANTVYFVCPLSKTNVITVSFELPDKTVSGMREMKLLTENGLDKVVDENGNVFNMWSYEIPSVITEQSGAVTVQFYAYTDSGEKIATASNVFTVEKGVPPLEEGTDDVYGEIINNISQIQSQCEQLQTEKRDIESGVSGKTMLYSVDKNGNQTLTECSISTAEGVVPVRDNNGYFKVGVQEGNVIIRPSNPLDVVNVYYVQEKIDEAFNEAINIDATVYRHNILIEITNGTAEEDDTTSSIKVRFSFTNETNEKYNSLLGLLDGLTEDILPVVSCSGYYYNGEKYYPVIFTTVEMTNSTVIITILTESGEQSKTYRAVYDISDHVTKSYIYNG